MIASNFPTTNKPRPCFRFAHLTSKQKAADRNPSPRWFEETKRLLGHLNVFPCHRMKNTSQIYSAKWSCLLVVNSPSGGFVGTLQNSKTCQPNQVMNHIFIIFMFIGVVHFEMFFSPSQRDSSRAGCSTPPPQERCQHQSLWCQPNQWHGIGDDWWFRHCLLMSG